MNDPLARTLRDQGKGLPTPWPRLNRYFKLEPKSTMNIFSAPKVGKSMWALNLCYGVQVPCLYVTLDTPLRIQAMRLWALASDVTIREVEANPKYYRARAHRVLRGRVQWSDVPMSIDDLPDLTAGVAEYLGELPRIIILDNISNLVNEFSYAEFSHAFNVMKSVAFKNRATVIALHHAQKKRKPTEPVYLNDVEYAGDKQPDVVCGPWRRRKYNMRFPILGNRIGEGAPDGSAYVDFHVDYERARIYER